MGLRPWRVSRILGIATGIVWQTARPVEAEFRPEDAAPISPSDSRKSSVIDVPAYEVSACSPALPKAGGEYVLRRSVGGLSRSAVLRVPASYASGVQRMPLLILAPGSHEDSQFMLEVSRLGPFAESHGFLLMVLNGKDEQLNVIQDARQWLPRPDDVEYTRSMLDVAQQQVCIDSDRIFCAGYSRGARFCTRLASEASDIVAAIAAISGIVFPHPNNATRAVPVIAFHGTADHINPFGGHGKHPYWQTPVEASIARWAKFNDCQHKTKQTQSAHVVVELNTQCANASDVVLVQVIGAGHTWPGTAHVPKLKVFGSTTHEVNANVLLWEFFLRHPMFTPLTTATKPKEVDGGSSPHYWFLIVASVIMLTLTIPLVLFRHQATRLLKDWWPLRCAAVCAGARSHLETCKRVIIGEDGPTSLMVVGSAVARAASRDEGSRGLMSPRRSDNPKALIPRSRDDDLDGEACRFVEAFPCNPFLQQRETMRFDFSSWDSKVSWFDRFTNTIQKMHILVNLLYVPLRPTATEEGCDPECPEDVETNGRPD